MYSIRWWLEEMTIALYESPGKYVGCTRTLQEPRKGELLLWRDKTYRIVDIAHPTNDHQGQGALIEVTRVLISLVSVAWPDGLK